MMALLVVFFGNSGEAYGVTITQKAPQNEKANQYNLVEKKKKKAKPKPKAEEEEDNGEAVENTSLDKSNEEKIPEDSQDYTLADILKAAQDEHFVENPPEDAANLASDEEKQPVKPAAKKGKKKRGKKNAKPTPTPAADEDEEAEDEQPAPKKAKGKKKSAKKGIAQLN